MITYLEIFLALKHPLMARNTFTLQTRAEWKQFFGMMETLERAQIAEFKNGRYQLHQSRKQAIIAQAEAVLADMSKPLTLPTEIAPDFVEAAAPAPVMSEFNTCPRCNGKGRVNIEDELGFFGNFICLTCYGKGKVAAPPRSTFPPIALPLPASVVAEALTIPQALEVGGVRVIVEAPALAMPSITVEAAAEGLVSIAEKPALVSADCLFCKGLGVVEDPNSQHPWVRVMACAVCGGTGEDNGEGVTVLLDDDTQPLPELNSSSGESTITKMIEPVDAMGDGGFVWHDRVETPAQTIPEILSTIQEHNQALIELERIADKELRAGIQKNRVVLKSFTKKSLPVRVNWTTRGMSSGVFDLLGIIRQYGKMWYMVKVETDKVYRCPVLPELCELVNTPQAAPKAVEVIAPQPNLLEGLPIMQAISQHGVEDTKAALNVVHERVVAETLNGNKLLVAEGQA